MIDEQDLTNVDSKGIAFTIRSVFIIDPAKKIRLIMSYPASTGRNTAEVLRVVDSLQTGDKRGVTTPINWLVWSPFLGIPGPETMRSVLLTRSKPGDDVIVPPTVNNEAAKEKFGEFREVKPWVSKSNCRLKWRILTCRSYLRFTTLKE
jgi:alkyl hydroperoxide reductase subunit AhpC